MKLLVTGGCGFIGTNFIRAHLAEYPEDTIVNLDALTYAGNPENLRDLEGRPNYHFVHGDIADVQLVDRLFAEHKFDVVINFAAESHVDRSIENPQVFLRTNVLGTQALVDAARRYGVERYIQISTDEVYGSLGPEGAFKETTPLAPRSPYSASKAAADQLVLAYYHTYCTPVLITRCSNNYGPYQYPEKLLPLSIINLLHDREVPVYGDGMQRREWLHVSDHCRAIELVLRHGRIGEVYNIGGVNERPNLEVLHLLLEIMGKPRSLLCHVEDRPGHDRRYAIDSTKIRTELGWQPQVNFEDGLRSTVQWYLDHRDWWERILSGEFRAYYEKMYGSRKRLNP
ncbi:MAG: dTDP-glucose 4,6-dehydratase [Candidatus Sumerlaea chitinivorans]|nr:dTDP-glucose 4,6-dehydratase [Candidatus Sumerlaea chitinivorans]